MPLRPVQRPLRLAPAPAPAEVSAGRVDGWRPRGPARALGVTAHDYVVICISTYVRDLAKLDSMVAELKRRGLTKANRSALIRVALDRLDLDAVAADFTGGLRAR